MQCLGCERVTMLNFPPVVFSLQFEAGISADAVATGEVNY